MKTAYYKQIRAFLQSPEATASAFSSIGWDVEKDHGAHAFWCVVNYGILEEMELDIILHGDDNWFAELYIPPVLPQHETQADAVCAQVQKEFPPLVAAVDTDRAVLIGTAGTGDPIPTLKAMWHAFAQTDVYESVLFLSGLTAPTEEDKIGYDIPDDPFGDEE